nr:ribonuclease T [Legionella jordanis]
MIRLFAWLWLAFPLVCFSSIEVNGKYEAQKICPLYVSKNKRTNPDGAVIQLRENYEIREVNRPNNPDWLRLIVPNLTPSLRWVHADCGIFYFEAHGKNSCEQLPNLADSYILALSWHPGFCQSYGYEAGKAECKHLKANAYSAHHLILHGLWPNQQICGEHYGYCAVNPRKNHCDYPPLAFSAKVDERLRQFMPSYAAGTCLERHEWYKHGSCQILTNDAYFSLAMRLNDEFNHSALGEFISVHAGDKVKREQLRKLVVQSFGQTAAQRVYFGCKDGLLVDVWLQLPALIPQQESLFDLMQKSADFKYNESCPRDIRISDFNADAW